MSEKIKVLFICVHNSARSQMAEAYLTFLGSELFSAESAGLEPGVLNSTVVQVMMEDGIDISNNKTKSVGDILAEGKAYHYVIAVCDEANADRCPVFLGEGEKLHWSFLDPSSFSGTDNEKREGTRIIRDEIKNKIENWIKSIN